MKKHYWLLAFLALLIGFSGCNSGKELIVVQEDFDQFYDQFHLDETFQMSRIVFPLEWGSEDTDGKRTWTGENWITMKVKIYDVDTSTYKVDWHRTEDSFVQKFWLEGTGFGAEYRFKRMGGKWYLVFAYDSNL